MIIGKKIIVVDATNKSLIGLQGMVVDETKSLIIIMSEDGRQRKLLKSAIAFRLENKLGVISGLAIRQRPEERLKRREK